jgi:hypothetical protein
LFEGQTISTSDDLVPADVADDEVPAAADRVAGLAPGVGAHGQADRRRRVGHGHAAARNRLRNLPW